MANWLVKGAKTIPPRKNGLHKKMVQPRLSIHMQKEGLRALPHMTDEN